MSQAKVLKLLKENNLIHPDLWAKIEDGSLLKYRNFGKKSYLELCEALDVKPYEPPKTPQEVKRPLIVRLKNRISTRKAEIRNLEERIERLNARMPNAELCDRSGKTSNQR